MLFRSCAVLVFALSPNLVLPDHNEFRFGMLIPVFVRPSKFPGAQRKVAPGSLA